MKAGLLIRSVASVLVLPVMVAGVLPGIVIATEGGAIGAGLQMPLNVVVAAIGLAVATIGLFLAAGAIRRFSTEGEGTLAPWDPPRKLVVRGSYRYVRNPMISGVLSIVAGEAIFFGSKALFGLFLVTAVINAIYMPLSEEPDLAARFGEDYEIYRRHVPRWIPRSTPWEHGNMKS